MSVATSWDDFFDADYIRLWSETITPDRTAREAEGIWNLCGLRPGARVLDAPCGYGRLSRALAERGASVVGVDVSPVQLQHADLSREGVGKDRLEYRRADLRQPLKDSGFDAAINIFTSLGYGSEDEDAAVLGTLASAVRKGGVVLLETLHRDMLAANFSRGLRTGRKFSDGTLFVEESTFDSLAGRAVSHWLWSGPKGSGEKTLSIRIYTLTELTRLMERAGLTIVGTFSGCTSEPFRGEGPEMGGRVALLGRKP